MDFQTVSSMLVSDLMRDFNLSQAQAQGFAGALAMESGGFQQLQEMAPIVPGSRGGYGFAQWTGPRRNDYEDWAARQGLNPASYEANYGFLKHELQNRPQDNGAVLRHLQGAKTAQDAAQVVTNRYLRPGIVNMPARMDWTNRVVAQSRPMPPGNIPSVGSNLSTQRAPVPATMSAGLRSGAVPQPRPVSDIYNTRYPQVMPPVDPRGQMAPQPRVNPDDTLARLTGRNAGDSLAMNPAPFSAMSARGMPSTPSLPPVRMDAPLGYGRTMPGGTGSLFDPRMPSPATPNPSVSAARPYTGQQPISGTVQLPAGIRPASIPSAASMQAMLPGSAPRTNGVGSMPSLNMLQQFLNPAPTPAPATQRPAGYPAPTPMAANMRPAGGVPQPMPASARPMSVASRAPVPMPTSARPANQGMTGLFGLTMDPRIAPQQAPTPQTRSAGGAPAMFAQSLQPQGVVQGTNGYMYAPNGNGGWTNVGRVGSTPSVMSALSTGSGGSVVPRPYVSSGGGSSSSSGGGGSWFEAVSNGYNPG